MRMLQALSETPVANGFRPVRADEERVIKVLATMTGVEETVVDAARRRQRWFQLCHCSLPRGGMAPFDFSLVGRAG